MIYYISGRLVSIALPFISVINIQSSNIASPYSYVLPLTLSLIALVNVIGSYDSGQIFYTSRVTPFAFAAYVNRNIIYTTVALVIALMAFKVTDYVAIFSLILLSIVERFYDEYGRFLVLKRKYKTWLTLTLACKIPFFSLIIASFHLDLMPWLGIAASSFSALLAILIFAHNNIIFKSRALNSTKKLYLRTFSFATLFVNSKSFFLYNFYIIIGFASASFLPVILNLFSEELFKDLAIVIMTSKVQNIIFSNTFILNKRQDMIASSSLRDLFNSRVGRFRLSPSLSALILFFVSFLSNLFVLYFSPIKISRFSVLIISALTLYGYAINLQEYLTEWSLRKNQLQTHFIHQIPYILFTLTFSLFIVKHVSSPVISSILVISISAISWILSFFHGTLNEKVST